MKSWNYISEYYDETAMDYMQMDSKLPEKIKTKDLEPLVKKMLKDKDETYNLLKQHMHSYQSLVPGESDEIFIPPVLSTSKMRTIGNNDMANIGLGKLLKIF